MNPLTLPLAPMRAVIWLAERILEQAENEYYDVEAIRRELQEIQAARGAGEISDEDADLMEEALLDRLLEDQTRSRT